MTRLAKDSGDIAQEAAEWVIRCDRGLSVEEKVAFEAWTEADPKHRAEFARVASSWKSLERLAPSPGLSAEADAIVFRAQARRNRRHRIAVMAGGLLATAAVIVFGYFVMVRPTPPAAENIKVIASTSHDITLPDGSIATLNGDSRIEIDYTPGERRIRLVKGEALFKVVKDPNRPFYVTAGPVTVRAVGTAFNVRMGAAAVEVLVTEGKVRVNNNVDGSSLLPPALAHDEPVSSALAEGVLIAGQRVVVELAAVVDVCAQARVATVAPAEVERSLAWQSTQLVFNDTPLNEVVAAFNRYNQRQLVVGDNPLNSRKITGVFRADNLDGFTRLLEAGVDVKAEPRGDRETVLRAGH